MLFKAQQLAYKSYVKATKTGGTERGGHTVDCESGIT